MQQCRHCTLRTYVSRTSIIAVLNSIDRLHWTGSIREQPLDFLNSTTGSWLNSETDLWWAPTGLSPVQSSSFWRILISDLISEVHTFFENPSLMYLKRKNIKFLVKTFFQIMYVSSKVLRILKMLRIILKIQQEVVNIWIFSPIKWHPAEKN